MESKQSWGRDKWVDDTVLNDYFLAMSENINNDDILFLGPSATSFIRFSTKDDALDSLKLTHFINSKFIFLCVSDSSEGGKDDSGSHWSLLFLIKSRGMAYHFDSLNSRNITSARIIANQLGIETSNVEEMPCIQQKNSFECGINVLSNAKYIAYHYCVTKENIPFIEWFGGMDIVKAVSSDSVQNNLMGINTTHSKTNKTHTNLNKRHKATLERSRKNKNGPLNINRSNSPKQTMSHNKFEILNILDAEETNVCDNIHTPSSDFSMNKKKESVCSDHVPLLHLDSMADKTDFKSINRPRLTVVCDSQGRNLADCLERINKNSFNIFNHCQPGAPIEQVFDTLIKNPDLKTYSNNDFVVVIGGTNNITSSTACNSHVFLKTFASSLKKNFSFLSHTNVIISTLPYRYDLNENSPENKLIKDTNLIIRQEVYNQRNIQLVDIYLFHRCYQTRHGLHLNRKGKQLLSKEIQGLIKTVQGNIAAEIKPQKKQANLETGMLSSEATDTESPITETCCTIEVIEASMLDVINENKEDSDTAFAHCISGDFGDLRQMSAGVAVTFKKVFGKPKRSDCLSNYLTLQESMGKAAVYGLVTKPTYCSKPSTNDYDRAFHELIDECIKKKYKKVICSPMGCVRDRIPPTHFVQQIAQLHHKTGATVIIVVNDERASRHLRNGLKYEDFLKLLRDRIDSERGLLRTPISTQKAPSSTSAAALFSTTQSDLLEDSANVVARTPKLDSPVTSEVAKEMSFDELQQSFNDSFHGWPSPQSAVSSNRHLETKNSPETTHLPTS